MPAAARYVGTAGWAIPRAHAHLFPAAGSGLARYAALCNAAEINSTFYRTHRPSTFERWHDSVPAGFRFAVKVPRLITHEQRLAGSGQAFAAFASSLAGLGGKLGPLLLQLPPKFAFDEPLVETFLRQVSGMGRWTLVLEPRHPSWFATGAEALLAAHHVARVGADPPRAAGGALPGGARQLTYLRLHGSPRLYFDAYSPGYVAALAARIASDPAPVWCIFDNTASGAALGNALELRRALG